MSRAEKIAKLAQKKARNAPESLADYTILADAMEKIVADFSVKLERGIDVNDLDLLVDRLGNINELRTSVDKLKESIKNFPPLPDEVKIASINEFLDAIKGIEIKAGDVIVNEKQQPDYTESVIKLAQAVEDMAISIKATAPKAPSQRPPDYIPYRRVVKAGNSFIFDDNPTPQAGPGGGASIPTRKNSSGDVYVPVANPDGTDIGGGTGGDASAANQITEIENQDPLAKYRIADEDSLTTTQYFGFVSSTNANKWYVLKVDKTDAVAPVEYHYRYANLSNNATRTEYGAAGATGAWANRSSLTYDYLYNLTGL